MLNELKLWPTKLREGQELGQLLYQKYEGFFKQHHHTINRIAFVGMGGSGIAGRIAKTFLDKRSHISSFIVDGPSLPAFADTQTLAIVISYSGNTWETLEVLEQLTAKFIPTVVISHGGRAAEVAGAKGLPCVLLPQSKTPRSSLGHTLGLVCALFDAMVLLPGNAMIAEWIEQAQTYAPCFEQQDFFDDFLTVVGFRQWFHVWGIADDSAAAAYRATTQFNENAKVQAVYNTFPELTHNLLVGFSKPQVDTCVLFFQTDFLSGHLSMAVQSIGDILKEKGVGLYKSPVFGNTFESQVFNMILWADFASYHLGHVRGEDIEQVHIIDELKKRQKVNGIT